MLETDFSGADLRRSNFAAAELQSIRLTQAELDNADFSHASVDQATRDQARAAQLPVGSASSPRPMRCASVRLSMRAGSMRWDKPDSAWSWKASISPA